MSEAGEEQPTGKGPADDEVEPQLQDSGARGDAPDGETPEISKSGLIYMHITIQNRPFHVVHRPLNDGTLLSRGAERHCAAVRRHAQKLKEACDSDDKHKVLLSRASDRIHARLRMQTVSYLQVWGSTWELGDAPCLVEVRSFPPTPQVVAACVLIRGLTLR